MPPLFQHVSLAKILNFQSFSTYLFRKDTQLRAQKYTKTRPPKLANQLPRPALFEHLSFANMLNYVIKKHAKTRPPAAHATTFPTSFFRKGIQLRAQKYAKTRPPKLPSQHPMPAVFEHVFFAKIFNYVIKSIPKLDLQNWSASPPCQHFFNTSPSQRCSIT